MCSVINTPRGSFTATVHPGHSTGSTVRRESLRRFATTAPISSVYKFVFVFDILFLHYKMQIDTIFLPFISAVIVLGPLVSTILVYFE